MELKALKKAKVLVVGDLMLDHYINGSVDRISPEAPVPVIRPKNEEFRLGGAANVATNISSLGGKPKLLGIIGKDNEGSQIKKLLKESSVSNVLVVSKKPSVTKQRIVVSKQQILRLDKEDFFSKDDSLELKKIFIREAKKYPLVILSDYNKGSLREVQKFIKIANKKGSKVLVDPKGEDFKKYKGASILTPNYNEFCRVLGIPKNESDLTKKGHELIKNLGLEALLITRGPEGMTLLRLEKKKILRNDFLAEAKEVFDVSGAGDTVLGAFALALASGMDIVESVKLANIAAGIVVGKFGTSVVSLDEILKQLSQSRPSKLLTHKEAISCILSARSNQEKIVFTNGCFDILHLGHVAYLQKAKDLGEKLIVAVNSDSSVRNLKGKRRPINKLADRMEVLASLECVDWIISFSEDSPDKVIKKLKPNVLVKGNDYKIKEIAGSDFVKSYGGEVKTIPLIKGVSTSSIVEKIGKVSS